MAAIVSRSGIFRVRYHPGRSLPGLRSGTVRLDSRSGETPAILLGEGCLFYCLNLLVERSIVHMKFAHLQVHRG